MLSKVKKYFLIAILLGLSYGAYWWWSNVHKPLISKWHLWHYSFEPKSKTTFDGVSWKKSKQKEAISEENKSLNLIFRTEFNPNDYARISEGILEFNNKYSAKILINGVEYADVSRHLISSSLEGEKIKVERHGKPRKVKIKGSFLEKTLKKGKNAITLIVYNTEELKSVQCSRKQLSFFTKRQKSIPVIGVNTFRPKRYFSESTLPIIKINTANKAIPDEPKISASLNIINNSNKINKLIDSSEFHNIKIERRGNTSQVFSKKSYSFNVYDKNVQKIAIKLLDLPPSKKWVLYGPFADKSLIRNALTYSIYTQMGNYAPRTQFIDLVVNNNYQGIYLLTEKIQISPNHLNIPPLKISKNNNLVFSGGYLLEIDRNEWKAVYPLKTDVSAYPVGYMVYAPKKKKIPSSVQEIIKSQYTTFEQHLYENDNIYNYLDLNSFIDYLIITEFTKNIDGYCLSTFLYNKEITNETPKFYIGPIWDYNFSFGLADYREGFNPEGYVYNSTKYIPFWWKVLLENKTFKSTLKSRYFELRKTSLSESNINNTVDSLTAICKQPNELNFKKWSVLNSKDFWPNYYLGKTYEDEINYLKKWIKKRLHFLDEDILSKEKKDTLKLTL